VFQIQVFQSRLLQNTLNLFKFDVEETLDIVRSTTDMSRYFTLEKNSLYSYPKCCWKHKVLEFWLGYKGNCEPSTLELGLARDRSLFIREGLDGNFALVDL
jgi:hypothetical protein